MAEKVIVTTNPATGAEIAAFEPHDDAYVDRALTAAADAQKAWRRVSVDDRVKLLAGMARVQRAGKPKYAAPITQEMGKPIVEAEAEIEKCAYNCDFYAAQAGKALKKQVLELGGSDAFIVLADANPDEAAAFAVKARYINVGQSCVNAKLQCREQHRRSFRRAILRRGCQVEGRRPHRARHQYRPDGARKPDGRTSRAGREDNCCRCRTEGRRRGGRPSGLFLCADRARSCSARHGRLLRGDVRSRRAIIRAKDAEDAVRLANQTEFGLGSAIWTRDIARARTLARDIDAGAVVINDMVASDPRYPFGGIKRSGYGRELGVYGIREFVNTKSVWIGPAKPAA